MVRITTSYTCTWHVEGWSLILSRSPDCCS